MMKTFLLLVFLSSSFLHGIAQQGVSKIDKTDLKTFVSVLASDSLEGRGTGTRGQEKAAKYISDRFTELGLHPFSHDSYYEEFELKRTRWGEVFVRTQDKTFHNFGNMVFQGSYPQNEEVEKEVVFGGRGSREELDQIDVQDRLVLVLVDNLRGNYDLNSLLARKKAAGLILANPGNARQFEVIKNTFRDYSLRESISLARTNSAHSVAEWDTLRFINTIMISNADVKSLSGLSIRELTKLVTEKRIKDAPVTKIRLRFERIGDVIHTANVVGVIKGKGSKSIVISAHYDHLGKSGKEFFPGADDNASGIAALLELAEAFSGETDLPHSIVFLATSAEEAGLLGSIYHVNTPQFDPKNILCNLNLDMISRRDDRHRNSSYLYCIGTGQSAQLDSVIQKADSMFGDCHFDYSLNSADPAGIFARTDSYTFSRKGIPAIHFFSGLNSDYHQPTDTPDKINFEDLANRVRLIGLVIGLLQK